LFVALIPFFAFRNLKRALGADRRNCCLGFRPSAETVSLDLTSEPLSADTAIWAGLDPKNPESNPCGILSRKMAISDFSAD